MKFLKTLSILGVSALLVSPAVSFATTNFPTETIKLIVPYPPGGPTDALARRLAQGVSDSLKATVIVENKAGANGNIGSESVAKSKADGHTILFGTSGPLAINSSLYKDLAYHPETSFEPIIKIGHLPNILVVHPSIKANNVQELIEYAKSNPDSLTYASSGKGASSHLAGVLFNTLAGTEILHIPYKGTGPALNDLLGGQVSMAFTDVLTALPHIKSNRLKALGLASSQRTSALPDLATIDEQGLKGYDVSVFFGVVAPANTSESTIKQLNNAFQSAMASEEIQKTLESQGIVEAKDKTPNELKNFIHDEVTKWAKVINDASLNVD